MNNINLTYGYQGEVTIKYLYKNGTEKTILKYNHGTSILSKLFAKMLIGYDVRADVPVCIDLLYTTSSDDTNYQSILKSSIPLTGSIYLQDSDGYWYASYNALITYYNRVSTLPTSAYNSRLVLKNTSGEILTILALSSDDAVKTLLANQGTNIVINWKMKLINYDAGYSTTTDASSNVNTITNNPTTD